MKKALALILALIMLCSSVAMITAYAADEVAINIEEMPGYEKAYIGKPISTPPVQDGEIGDYEYTFSRQLKPYTANKTNITMEAYTNPTTEYWAYDADYIYYAYSNPKIESTGAQMKIRLEHDYVIGSTLTTFAAHRQLEDANGIQITIGGNASTWSSSEVPSGKQAPAASDIAVCNKRTEGSGYTPAVTEFKISRHYLADQMGLKDASGVTKFTYSAYATCTLWDGSNWIYLHLDHLLTSDQMTWLTSKGLTTSLGASTSGDQVSRLYNMVVLGEDPSLIDIEKMPGYEKGYIGSKVDSAPVQDGVISEGEYTLVRKQYNVSTFRKGSFSTASSMASYTAPSTEYMAYDNEWIYYAYTHSGAYTTASSMLIRLEHDYIIDQTPLTHTNRQLTDENGITITFNPTGPEAGTAPTGHNAPTPDQMNAKIVGGGGYTKPIVLEFKISRAYLAAEMGLKDASAVTKFTYSTYVNDSSMVLNSSSNWQYASIDTMLTESQMTWLKDRGVTTTMDYNNSGSLNRVCNMVVLGEDVLESVAAENGLNIYVGDKIEKAPVLDGVVSEGEYSHTVTNTYTPAMDSAEIQSPVVEYFAYDDDYFYYAAEYVQKNDGRSFQFQWKPFNAFRIFQNPGQIDTSIHQRINTHIRLNSTTTDGETTFSTAVLGETLNYTNVATNPVRGTDVSFAVAKNTTTNLKTHEIRISLDYIAKTSGYAKSDVRVIPYFMYAHTTPAAGHAYTAEDIADLNALGVSYTPSVGEWGYKFIVLDTADGVTVGQENYVPEDTKWETLANDLELTIKVQPVTKTPVMDGIISANEYPTHRETPVANLTNGIGVDASLDGGSEIQGDKVDEYFGHDAEYVYYAISFTQAADNRACWPRFKVANTFDIYNGTHNLQAAYQARFSQDASGNTINYVNGIGAQGGLKAFVDGSDIWFAAEKDRETNLKTYEFRIAKSYFASFKGIDTDDVKVIPYYTYFHASTALANVVSTAQAEAIAAKGGTTTDGTISYYFMVLEGETVKIEDRITINTQEEASIRLSPNNSGLRFKSEVSTADLETLMRKYDYIKVGTLIAPEDFGLDLSTVIDNTDLVAGTNYIDVEADVANPFGHDKNINVFAGSITNFKGNNAGRTFEALGYIAYSADGVNWTYVYSETTAFRSAAYVAQEAINSGDYDDDTAALAILNAYAAVTYEAN